MGVRASAPLRRKRGSEAPSPAAEPPLELAIISDPGEDLDDELAMVYLRHLVALYPSLVVRCVVCNLRPARKRAALMRQTLDALNMKHVPVGVGDEVVPPSRARDDDEDWAFIDAGAYASVHAAALLMAVRPFRFNYVASDIEGKMPRHPQLCAVVAVMSRRRAEANFFAFCRGSSQDGQTRQEPDIKEETFLVVCTKSS